MEKQLIWTAVITGAKSITSNVGGELDWSEQQQHLDPLIPVNSSRRTARHCASWCDAVESTQFYPSSCLALCQPLPTPSSLNLTLIKPLILAISFYGEQKRTEEPVK